MKHLTIVADTHLASLDIDSLSLFPEYMKKHPKRYPELVQGLQSYHEQSLERFKERRPHEVFIHLGDLTSGWQESGLAHPDQITTAEDAVHAYRTMSVSFHMCWGDHDTGFTDQFGGLSFESLKACQTISPLWWSERIENLVFIGVTSTLARYDGNEAGILALQMEQAGFVWSALKAADGAKWVLCSHQRDILPYLKQATDEYKGTFAALIHAHEHNPKASKFLNFFKPIRGKFASKRMIFCPSISPLWWQGAGYLTGGVDNERLFTAIDSFKPVDAKKPLFSGFWKCLYWCMGSYNRRK